MDEQKKMGSLTRHISTALKGISAIEIMLGHLGIATVSRNTHSEFYHKSYMEF